MPTGTALRLTASVGGNRAAGPPGFMGMTDHSDLGTHLIGSRRHAREETSSGRSPANKARSAVRAARVPPSDRAQEPGLPAGRDGWPDCPLGVAGTLRPRHACIACGAPPGPVHRGRRVTQTGQSTDEHRVRTQRVSVGASGRRGFLHVAGLVELVELRHLLTT